MKYFFFDVDGTLKPYIYKMPISTRNTIRKLQENGNDVFLATGRDYNEAKPIMEALEIKNAVCSGGGTVVIDNKIEREIFLKKQEVEKILYECEKYNIIMVNLSGGKCYTTYKGKKLNPYIQFMKKMSKTRFFKVGSVNGNALKAYMDIEVLEKEEFLNKPAQKILFYNYKLINKVQSLKSHRIHNNRYCASIEFEFKEKGIEYLRTKFNLSLDDIVVFGDGRNDISMFQYAKNAIAMGNACNEIKEIASFVTKKSHKDGIEYACKYFKWI